MARSSLTHRASAARARHAAPPAARPAGGPAPARRGRPRPDLRRRRPRDHRVLYHRQEADSGGRRARAVEMQVVGGQEKIVVAGIATNLGIGLARYNLNGTLDTSFGTGGKVATSFNVRGGSIYQTKDMAIQPDGKIVVVGTWKWEGSVRPRTTTPRISPSPATTRMGAWIRPSASRTAS